MLTVFVAAVLWFVMFVLKPVNFWLEMCLSLLLLLILAFIIKRDILAIGKIRSRHLIIGIISALLLYLIFYLGNMITDYVFPFKDVQITSIYQNKAGTSPVIIGALLLFFIGPGEELYWRGFIQKVLAQRMGENKGYIVATILYAGVHLITRNLMLVLAALVCGVFWGYIIKKRRA